MFKLDYADGKPIYEQIKDNFKQLIIEGVLKTDDRIPSVRELAISMAINPNTIQKAYKELEDAARELFFVGEDKEKLIETIEKIYERGNTHD